MIWQAQDRSWDVRERTLIMGVLNVTPDSFSDGGRYLDVERALAHAASLVREGADIVDVGGESTRPGAVGVGAEEEARRVVPVIAQIRARYDVAVSIDTSKARVAKAAIEAGACIINDVTALRGDAEMAPLAASTGAGLILMHMQGTPRSMQQRPFYRDVVEEVAACLQGQADLAQACGVGRSRVAIDPGIGFGKNLEHNVTLLRELKRFAGFGFPLVLGVSRKSFIASLLGDEKMSARAWPTVALTSYAVESGARLIRVHDVAPNVQAARMTEAILHGAGSRME